MKIQGQKHEYTFIYGLVDPRTVKVRYIGKSNHPYRRVKEHVSERHRNSNPKCLWIQELWDLNLRPQVHIIMRVPYERWKHFEQRAIEQYGGIDELLNLRPAGDEPPAPWDEHHRENHRRAMKKAAPKTSVKSQAMWDNPAFRERHKKAIRQAQLEGRYDIPFEECQARSERLSESWADSEFRGERIESIVKGWDNQGRRDRLSEWNRKNWENPEYRKNMIAQFTETAQKQEHKERLAEYNCRRWANPEEHRKQSERAKKRWADPEERRKQSQRVKKALARKREMEAKKNAS